MIRPRAPSEVPKPGVGEGGVSRASRRALPSNRKTTPASGSATRTSVASTTATARPSPGVAEGSVNTVGDDCGGSNRYAAPGCFVVDGAPTSALAPSHATAVPKPGPCAADRIVNEPATPPLASSNP